MARTTNASSPTRSRPRSKSKRRLSHSSRCSGGCANRRAKGKRRLAETPLQRFRLRVICGENNERTDRHPTNGKNRQLVQATRLHFPIQRNLWRSEWRLGLRPARCRIKAQSEELLVARHGARTR